MRSVAATVLGVSPGLASAEGGYARAVLEIRGYGRLENELSNGHDDLTIGATYVVVRLGLNGARIEQHAFGRTAVIECRQEPMCLVTAPGPLKDQTSGGPGN